MRFADLALRVVAPYRDSVNNLSGLPFTPSYEFDTFSTFDDPFSYSTPARQPFDAGLGLGVVSGLGLGGGIGGPSGRPHPGHGDPDAFINGEESSPQELDNKLLGFGAPLKHATLVDDVGNLADVDLTAELYGMFFVAEDVFGGTDAAAAGRPLELTCYRRNLWQCSGQITLPRQHLATVMTDQHRQSEVLDLAASITAIESIEGKPTEIISIPWKSSSLTGHGAGASSVSDEPSKVAGPPPRVQLDPSTGQDLDGNRVSVPVSWKRLQFKHATANNGRRKGLQQHYVVQINLLARTADGTGDDSYVKVAEIQSGPVIVRGRSPRNFDSRKDVSLSGAEKKLDRRTTDTSTTSAVGGLGNGGGITAAAAAGAAVSATNVAIKQQERSDLIQNMQRYHSLGNIQVCFPFLWFTPNWSNFWVFSLSLSLSLFFFFFFFFFFFCACNDDGLSCTNMAFLRVAKSQCPRGRMGQPLPEPESTVGQENSPQPKYSEATGTAVGTTRTEQLEQHDGQHKTQKSRCRDQKRERRLDTAPTWRADFTNQLESIRGREKPEPQRVRQHAEPTALQDHGLYCGRPWPVYGRESQGDGRDALRVFPA
jgi:hypothetical protein